jgi:valyl-tRNA synthetase
MVGRRSVTMEPKSIMQAPYPQADERFFDEEAEQRMRFLMELVEKVRALKHELGWGSAKVEIVLACDEQTRKLVEDNLWWLENLGRISGVKFIPLGEKVSPAVSELVGSAEVFIPLGSVAETEKLKERWRKQLVKVEEELARLQARISNPEFVQKAPAEIVERTKERILELVKQREHLKSLLGEENAGDMAAQKTGVL